jgi:acyl-CoA thioester hydrolase
MTDTRKLLVTLPIRVNTYDIDVADHVNNTVYIRWLEDLRLEFLRIYYPLERLIEDGSMPIIHATEIVYHRSITLFDKPEGRMWCAEMGRATFRLEAEFVVEDRICATAAQRGILLRTGTTRPVRLPAELRRHFTEGEG